MQRKSSFLVLPQLILVTFLINSISAEVTNHRDIYGALGIRRKDAEACDLTDLMDYNHLTILPTLDRIRSSVPLKIAPGYDFCNLKSTCCEDSQLLNTRAAFIYLETYIDLFKDMFERFWNNPEDVAVMLESSFQNTLKGRKLTDKLRVALHKGAIIENTNNFRDLVNNMFTLMNSLMGYFSGLSCSVCDPNSRPYLNTTLGHDKLFLQLNANICDDITSNYMKFLTSIETLFMDKKVQGFILAVMYESCLAEDDYMRHCDRHSLESDLNIAISMYIEGGRIFDVFCDTYLGKEGCRAMVCEKTLAGLAVNMTSLARNVLTYMYNNCESGWNCHQIAQNFVQHMDIIDKTYVTKGKLNVSVQNVFIKAEDAKKDNRKFFNAMEMGRKSKMARDAFNKVNLGFHHEESGSVFGRLFRMFILLGLFGAAGYGAYYVYKRRMENDAFTSYSILGGSV